jgi:hypothetical protein
LRKLTPTLIGFLIFVVVVTFIPFTGIPVAKAATINVLPGGSIQAAINAANPLGGDTINVAAGTYTEGVVHVNRSVTLHGDGSVIDDSVFVIEADSVTIDGFLFDGGALYWGEPSCIYACKGTGISGLDISNNIFLLGVGKSPTLTYSDPWEGTRILPRHALILNQYNQVGMSAEITHNDIGGGLPVGIYINPASGNNILIQYNSFHDSGTGISCDGSGVTIINNDFSKNQVGLSSTKAVLVGSNNFVNNELGVEKSIYGAIDVVIDATLNWWGDNSGPSGGETDPVTGKVASGTGDKVSANVCFDPWTTRGAPPAPPAGGGDGGGGGLVIAGITTLGGCGWIDSTLITNPSVILDTRVGKKAKITLDSAAVASLGGVKVMFLVDGKLKKIDKKAPFDYKLKVKRGTHTVTVNVLDSNGKVIEQIECTYTK